LIKQRKNTRSIKPDISNTIKNNVKYIQLTLKSNLSKSIKKAKAKAGEEPFLKFLKSVQQADVVGEELFPYFNNAIKKPKQGKLLNDCKLL